MFLGRGSSLFVDRVDAGEQLAERLAAGPPGRRVVVLGIPRGGVVVAAVVARRLSVPLDVVIPRKVGAPGNPELGLGAVAEGVEVLDEPLIRHLGVGEDYLRAAVAEAQDEIRRRARLYRGERPPLPLEEATAVVVDDGIATGGTAVAALRWARARAAERVELAIPVAPAESVPRMRREADDVHVLATPEPFYAVGQWYEEFEQVSDDEVISLLRRGGGGEP